MGKSYRIKVVAVAVRRLILRPRKRIKSRFPPPVAGRDYLACNGRYVTGNNAVESGGGACMHSLGDEDYLGSDANTLRICLAHIHVIVRRNRNSTLEGTERA